MANATYEIMWRDAMGDLNEQLNVEGVEEEEDMPSHPGAEGQKSVRHWKTFHSAGWCGTDLFTYHLTMQTSGLTHHFLLPTLQNCFLGIS
jgi:hypothetical protein